MTLHRWNQESRFREIDQERARIEDLPIWRIDVIPARWSADADDQLNNGGSQVTVTEVSIRRVLRLRFEPIGDSKEQAAP